MTVHISGITVDGDGVYVEAGIVYRDAQGSIAGTHVTDVVTSEAAGAWTTPGGWRAEFPGYGIAHVTAATAQPAGASPRELASMNTRVDRYNRAGLLIQGLGGGGAALVDNHVVVNASEVVGRMLCQNFSVDGNCAAPGLVTTGPLFGQDGVRVTDLGRATVRSSIVTQNLVNGVDAIDGVAPVRQTFTNAGVPQNPGTAGNANLRRGAGIRLVGADAASSLITRNNIIDNAYGVFNVEADGTTPSAVAVPATDNWWGKRFTTLATNPGPAISPAYNPPVPENPVNGAPVADGAGTSSSAVDFFPYRNGPQSDPLTGQFPNIEAPSAVQDDAPTVTLNAGPDTAIRGQAVALSAIAGDDFGVRKRHVLRRRHADRLAGAAAVRDGLHGPGRRGLRAAAAHGGRRGRARPDDVGHRHGHGDRTRRLPRRAAAASGGHAPGRPQRDPPGRDDGDRRADLRPGRGEGRVPARRTPRVHRHRRPVQLPRHAPRGRRRAAVAARRHHGQRRRRDRAVAPGPRRPLQGGGHRRRTSTRSGSSATASAGSITARIELPAGASAADACGDGSFTFVVDAPRPRVPQRAGRAERRLHGAAPLHREAHRQGHPQGERPLRRQHRPAPRQLVPEVLMSLARSMLVTLAVAAASTLAAAAPAAAYVDPPGCTQEVAYDLGIPTFKDVVGVELGAGGTGSTSRRPTADIYAYFDAMVAATATSDRVKVIRKSFGTSVLGHDLRFYVISSPDNIDNLDTGRADGPFWEGVKDGSVSEAAGLAAVNTRPAFGWITATPHGGEAAAAEAISRMLYELAARTDCFNLRRLAMTDLFLMPVRNPDGRDAPPGGVRTSAWAFDHNRDFGTQNQVENGAFLPLLKKYPGLFYIDAHQQTNGYFFPPNADPVHHEVSSFSLDFIQNRIGPALQRKFNDQSSAYQNYTVYDLFVPEYGDSVPSLLSGAAGMTFEKGTSEVYGKQVYDHYLAIDETVNVTVRDKAALLGNWTRQWEEAVDQGTACTLQPNKLVAPATTPIATEVPADLRVCGYFYRPDNHAGDTAELIRHMRRQGVHVYRLNAPASVAGREFGQETSSPQTLPAGTLYIPMQQPHKHWIQAVLGENPYMPVDYYYDVVQWSYSLQRGQSGNGFLTALPTGVAMTEIDDPAWGSAPPTEPEVYAFDTDSMRGLALAAKLLDAGAEVYRGADPFDAAGKHFETGAALVHASSVTAADIDIRALAVEHQTPVSALDDYPVDRYELDPPKIGLYFAGATEPNNPIRPAAGSPYPGHCGVGGNTVYCQALFTLTQKIGLPGVDGPSDHHPGPGGGRPDQRGLHGPDQPELHAGRGAGRHRAAGVRQPGRPLRRPARRAARPRHGTRA